MQHPLDNRRFVPKAAAVFSVSVTVSDIFIRVFLLILLSPSSCSCHVTTLTRLLVRAPVDAAHGSVRAQFKMLLYIKIN